ncbi:MAG: hypothetical protein KKG04_09715 [Candidatus Thermoplasmatota archaeon]|nr:hypothetical protein [Candidatus Thermoplasmatota archaeon]
MNHSTIPRIITVFLVFSFLFSIDAVSGQPEQENRPDWYKSGPYNDDAGPIVNFLANKLLPLIGWFNIGSGYAPKYFFAEPAVIEIDYLENTTIDIVFGSTRRESSGYQERVYDEVTLIYDAEFPPGIQENAWSVTFDPPVMDLRTYTQDYIDQGYKASEIPSPRTKLHLKLDIPPTTENPIQDLILRVNVSIVRKYTNLGKSGAFGGPILGRLAAFPYRKAYNEVSIGTKGCDIFVKVKPLRDAELILPDQIEMNPNDLKGARIAVRNRGSYIEQFGFRVYGYGKNLLVNSPSPITLAPGEIGYTEIGLVSRPIAYDRGTLHSITVEVYPYDQQNLTLVSGELTVRTKGFALQAVFSFRYSWHLFFAAIIIIFILILIAIIRRIKIHNLIKKPKKPWTLPEEKEHLNKLLKDKNKQAYNQEIEVMKQEYQSALLSYKSNLKSELREIRKQSRLYRFLSKIISLIKLPKKQTKISKKSLQKIIKSISQAKPIKQKKKIQIKTTQKPLASPDLQKQQLLEKIKKQQKLSR